MKEKIKKSLFHIFNILYSIWTIGCIYLTINDLSELKFNFLYISNTILMCYGFYFIWKFFTT